MAFTITEAALQNTLCDAVADRFDTGTTDAGGDVVIRDATTVLATIVLNNPAFGAAAAGVATLDNTPEPSATASGTGDADNCIFQDRDNTAFATGTVGTSGAEVNLDNVSITSGQTVTITDGTTTHPAS